VERHEDMLRSCLRVVDVLNSVPGAASSQAWSGFMRTTVMSQQLADKFLVVQKERLAAAAAAAASSNGLDA
jgi:cullin-associated NEDD8-dissociated protein 1